MRLAVTLLLATVVSAGALAQSRPTENVTVTGTRERQVLEKFVQGFAAPARMTGKLARWEDDVCPMVVGLKPQFTAFIATRVKQIAAQVGAPVNKTHGCKPNIHIVFTTKPQGLIDNIKKKQPGFLGYYDNNAQRDALATVSHPIQAWYTTATRDLRGNLKVDSGKTVGTGMEITYACMPPQEGMCTLHLSNAHGNSVTGSRLGDGMRSAFYTVIITAQPDRLMDQEIGTLADYIAFMALTQVSSLDTCQPPASIMNLLVAGCPPSTALTGNDLAYLQGLYKMSPSRILAVQESEIAYQMEQSLKGERP